MTCTNWLLTVLAAVIFVLTMWPTILSATVGKWIIAIAALIILVVTWTMVECKPCMAKKK